MSPAAAAIDLGALSVATTGAMLALSLSLLSSLRILGAGLRLPATSG
jgi:hypothetical protein